ncbi:MAG: hypothetical protein KF749_17070 [Bacteroidetes bacterium]|nr:hypothetical protein [Bacteroidota bacterium]MCW5895740.1 hypothetical protein [Bacteroidota bacterium]
MIANITTIYRYASFESFVDTILRKTLTFVHPSLWDDPYELHFLYQEIEHKFRNSHGEFNQDVIGAILQYVIAKKLYAQAWTLIGESDALWRIYSHGGTSVRIAVEKDKIKLLQDVELVEVDYVDNYDEVVRTKKDFYGLIAAKRRAFLHEREVRLVKHYKYSSADDANEHLTAFLALGGNLNQYFENIDVEHIGEEVDRLVKRTNLNLQDKTQNVSFAGIENFIDSVMLNPLAPEWLDKTLELFCGRYDLRYLGKSTLYKK